MEKLYGWSYKNHDDQYMEHFETEEVARKWLQTEEHDFRERELLTKSEARDVMGEDVFDNWDEEYRTRF